MSNIENIARQIKQANGVGVRGSLIELYNAVIRNPEQLSQVSDFQSVGYAFSCMLRSSISDDLDVLQRISSVAYLFLTLALHQSPNNVELKKQRIRTMVWAADSFGYTAMSAPRAHHNSYNAVSRFTSPEYYSAKMIIADIADVPGLETDFEFRKYWEEAGLHFRNRFSGTTCDYRSVAAEGREMHKALFEPLRNRIIDEADIDF